MAADDRSHVGHATVAHFQGVTLENLPELGCFWEVPGDKAQEPTSDVCADVFGVRRVEASDLPAVLLPAPVLMCLGLKAQHFGVSTGLKCGLVHRGCIVECRHVA